jgi:hypothetical protein
MSRHWITFLLLTLAAVVVLLLACGDDPVGPEPVTPKEYPIYFYSHYDDSTGYPDDTPRFMSYNPYTDVVDTFMLPLIPTQDLGISPDGQKLYVTTEDNVAIVDLKTRQLVGELPYPDVHNVETSMDGSRIALLGKELWILDAANYEVLYHDTDNVLKGTFSDDGKHFYCGRALEGGCVITPDSTPQKVCRQFPTGIGFLVTWQFEAIQDGARWLIYGLYADERWLFSTYDPAVDSPLFVDPLVPGQGEFVVTPDNKLAFYNNPGGMIVIMPPTFEISICNLQTNTLVDRISTIHQIDSTSRDLIAADELCMTPDGKWLLALTRFGQNTLILINVETLTIERYIELGGVPWLRGAVCQGRM